MNLEKLQEEVKGLDLKQNKDYLRFKTIRLELQEIYKEEFQRGRVPEIYFIQKKERESFENYPFQGYEYYQGFEDHVNKHYLNRDFKNFEQEQYMYNDLNLQYDRRRIFKLY